MAGGADRCAEPERSRRLRDPAMRAQLARRVRRAGGRAAAFTWDVLEVEAVARPGATRLGRAARSPSSPRERGCAPLDAFLDCSLAEDLETQWQTRLNEIGHATSSARGPRRRSASRMVMAGSSDGGAHLASFVGADYTTRLLTDWVPDPLTFEQAVWRLTGMPATVHGSRDRGFVREGAWADLLVIDRGAPARRAARAWRATSPPTASATSSTPRATSR